MPFYLRHRPRAPLWKAAAIGGGAIFLWTVLHGMIADGGDGILAAVLYTLLFTGLGAGLATLGAWLLGTRWVKPYLAARWATGAVLITLVLFLLSAATTHPDWAVIGQSSLKSSFVISTLLAGIALGAVIGFELFDKGATERVYLKPAQYNGLPTVERDRLRLDANQPHTPSEPPPIP